MRRSTRASNLATLATLGMSATALTLSVLTRCDQRKNQQYFFPLTTTQPMAPPPTSILSIRPLEYNPEIGQRLIGEETLPTIELYILKTETVNPNESPVTPYKKE